MCLTILFCVLLRLHSIHKFCIPQKRTCLGDSAAQPALSAQDPPQLSGCQEEKLNCKFYPINEADSISFVVSNHQGWFVCNIFAHSFMFQALK